MGIDDRDEDYRPRGQSPRRRGPYENSEPPAGRSSARGGRDDAPRPRSRNYDEPPAQRGGRRDYSRDDGPRSGARYDRSAPERGGYDRRPRPDQSGSGRRPREDWDADASARYDRRGGDPYARSDRSGRGQRPPMRDEWDTPARSRGGPRGGAPADSSARMRRPGAAVAAARGGLWGDDAALATGARRNLADARGVRRGAQEAEEEESSPGATVGKAVLAIVLALLIGAGAAYGYYLYSTPKIPANIGQPSSTPSGATHTHIAQQRTQATLALSRGAPVVVVLVRPAAPTQA